MFHVSFFLLLFKKREKRKRRKVNGNGKRLFPRKTKINNLKVIKKKSYFKKKAFFTKRMSLQLVKVPTRIFYSLRYRNSIRKELLANLFHWQLFQK